MDPARRAAGRIVAGETITARRAAAAVALTAATITLLSGVVIWLVDRDEFPNVGLGLWWAVQTVTTVGYGDTVPTERDGRLIAAIVMLTGIAFVSVVTAAIAAIFIESERRRLRPESAADLASRLGGIEERLDRIETALADSRRP